MLPPRVLRTKIVPPPHGPRTLIRGRVKQALLESLYFRVTILLAGAGYGKSTALSALSEEHRPLIWYQVTEEDCDPLVFLLHLCHSIQHVFPELPDFPTNFLEAWDGTQGVLPSQGIIDQIINALCEGTTEPVLLVLDDAPLVTSSIEIAFLLDRLIGLAPSNIHTLLSGRVLPSLPNLARWRRRGETLTIDQSVLAFDSTEITQLFKHHYGYELTAEEVESLLAYTEGWAIALQLIWQNLRVSSASMENGALDWQNFLPGETDSGEVRPTSQDSLFEMLAGEVFDHLPDDVREFLMSSATLRSITPEACDAIQSNNEKSRCDSSAMIAYLRRQEIFVVEQSDGSLRYHHIFRDFLRQQASTEARLRWHARAADYYVQDVDTEEAIYHMLRGQLWKKAATLLEDFGEQLLASGRQDTLSAYLGGLPPETLHQHPFLLFYMGDIARLSSRFQEALGWYKQAETIWRARGARDGTGRGLRGQARVYLDTLDAIRAEGLLQEAIRLSDGIEDRDTQARLYELLAENKLNTGQAEEAEVLRQKAASLRDEGPSESQLLFRVLIRTGRLDEAREGLEARVVEERDEPVHTPRAHRETLLLLSLVDVFQGRAERAYRYALEGTQRGAAFHSPFITAVGHMRQGHALILPQADNALLASQRYDLAKKQFEKSIEISQTLAVPRLRAEANWGLCRVYGYQGDLLMAQKVAQEGLDISLRAGDEWLAALVRLAMGAGLILASRYEAAEEWLSRSARSFLECSDPFGRCSARLWLSLGLFRQGEHARLEQILPDVLTISRQKNYGFLFTRPSLLGPPELHSLVPLLILARVKGWESSYAERLLADIGLRDIKFHPGYQLRVHTLGTFQVWRGDQQVPANSWRRDKSRQLFQILLTYRDAPLDRDQISEHLWPGLEPSASNRNFRIVLNALYQVLEPNREPGSESAYVVREGTIYSLRPTADIWLDCEEFISAIREAESISDSSSEETMQRMALAVELYKGEYLPDARYDLWAAAERERMAVLFLQAADRLSELLYQHGEFEKVIQLGHRILSQDNCWERAYRHLMLAYDQMGDHGQIGRLYKRCVNTLREELDVDPAPETTALFKSLTEDSS